MSEEQGQWLECVVDNDYEIWSEYPHPIRRKGSDKVVSECIDKSNDYVVCRLNNKKRYKHRIITQQFIPNPDNLPQVDHINRNRTDNRIENLRWVSLSDNNKNRASNKGVVYEFFDEIPCEDEDDIIEVRDYGTHQFEDLYFYDNWFYFWNGIQYKRLHIKYKKSGYAYVITCDVEGKQCCICYSKFKRIYDLM